MEVRKERSETAAGLPGQQELEAINRLARTPLTAEQVYTFSLRLCDNEVDRDFERFDGAALERLGELFLGKSGIFDHQWSARGQTARIYRTEVVREPSMTTAAGDAYCWLKGWAYLLRAEKNADLIAEIEGGIKKEVSVGCSVRHSVCSICGAEGGGCQHVKGQVYDGKLCFTELREPADAYEWSFVAVPAQRSAGVLKRFGQEDRQLARLHEEAALGRKYLAELRREVVRLLVRGGVTPLESAAGIISPVRGITTRTTTGGAADAAWRELTTVLIADDVIPSIRGALRSKFSRAKNTARNRGAIRSQVIVELEKKAAAEIIDGYGDVTVSASPDDPTVCLVEFSFAVAHGLNQIYLTVHITV